MRPRGPSITHSPRRHNRSPRDRTSSAQDPSPELEEEEQRSQSDELDLVPADVSDEGCQPELDHGIWDTRRDSSSEDSDESDQDSPSRSQIRANRGGPTTSVHRPIIDSYSARDREIESSDYEEERDLEEGRIWMPTLTPANTFYSAASDFSEGHDDSAEQSDDQTEGLPNTNLTESPEQLDEEVKESIYITPDEQAPSNPHRGHVYFVEPSRSEMSQHYARPRSASVSAARPLKSALARSPPSNSPPSTSELDTPRQRKSARFADESLDLDASVRRAGTDPWSMPTSPVTILDFQRLSAPPKATPRQHVERQDELFAVSPWISNEEENVFDRNVGLAEALAQQQRVDEQLALDEAATESAEDASSEDNTEEGSETDTLNLCPQRDQHDHSVEIETIAMQPLITDEDALTGETVSLLSPESKADRCTAEEQIGNDLTEHKIQEWSGEVIEMPAIDEDQASEGSDNIESQMVQHDQRCSSYSHPGTGSEIAHIGLRRTSSMTQAARVKGKLKVPAFIALKASPASPAFTVCTIHVAEPPRLNTVFENQASQYRTPERRDSKQSAHTVQSDHGTYQMLWEEPDPSNAARAVTLLLNPGGSMYVSDDQATLRTSVPYGSIPLDKVRTKLAAWNWEKEVADDSGDDNSQWLPLLPLTDSEERRRRWLADHSPGTENPPAPPNTGRSSARHSDQHTPAPEGEDDSSDSPIEINVRGRSSKSAHATPIPIPSSTDYLTVPRRRSSLPPSPSMTRELWSLGEDARFRSHRDSVEVTAGHLRRRELEGKINQELMTGHKDSFILTKSKFKSKYTAEHPANAMMGPSWNRLGGLSPIQDMSPPGSVGSTEREWWGSMDEAVVLTSARPDLEAGPGPSWRRAEVDEGERVHPDEHQECPICDEHRPRWFEANCRQGRLGSRE